MNEFDFEQTGANNKKVRSRLTDSVGIAFAETLAAIVGVGSIPRKPQHPFTQKIGNGKPVALGQKSTSQRELFEDAVEVDDATLAEGLQTIFSYENDRLSLINPRLKHTGKLDNAIRLAILTLYAYELIGVPEIDRSWLNDVLLASKLEDGHFRTWIAGCDEIINVNNRLKLSVPGRQVVKDVLKEVLDDSLQKGKIEFSKTSKRAKGGKRKETSDGESGSSNKVTASAKGPVYHLNQLVAEGYFDSPRKIGEIVTHLKDKKAEQYTASEMSTPLKRLMKSNKLKRDRGADGQYEYSKS